MADELAYVGHVHDAGLGTLSCWNCGVGESQSCLGCREGRVESHSGWLVEREKE